MSRQQQFEFIDVNPEHKLNDNYTRYVGYQDTNNILETKFYNVNVVSTISTKLTQLLMGVDKRNRPIIIPDASIINIMDSVYQNFRPQTGDIFSRYIMPNGENTDNYVDSMINQTIEIIYAQVKDNIEIDYNNSKLSVWTTVLGTMNENGLRSHGPIYTRQKRPQPMAFNMNY